MLSKGDYTPFRCCFDGVAVFLRGSSPVSFLIPFVIDVL